MNRSSLSCSRSVFLCAWCMVASLSDATCMSSSITVQEVWNSHSLTSSFLSLMTTAGTSRKGDIGTPLLCPSERKVHYQGTTRGHQETQIHNTTKMVTSCLTEPYYVKHCFDVRARSSIPPQRYQTPNVHASFWRYTLTFDTRVV